MARNRVVCSLCKAIRETQPASAVGFITTSGYVNRAVLNYLSLRADLVPLHIHDNAFSADPLEHARRMDCSDYVIASERGNSEAFEGFVRSGTIQDQTLQLVSGRLDFEMVLRVPTANQRCYFLFRRALPFSSLKDCSGLAAIEGPYPQWQLPKVRRAQGRATVLRFCNELSQSIRLHAICRTHQTGQVITVELDNRPTGCWELPGDFTNCDKTFYFSAPKSTHTVSLRYRIENVDWKSAVLFSALQLSQVPTLQGSPDGAWQSQSDGRKDSRHD